MADLPELHATPRQAGRKAVLTEIRRSGKIPAVLYGRGDPLPVALDAREVQSHIRHHGPAGILEITVDGDRTTAMLKQVDHHPVTGRICHLDLLRISMTDTVTAHVPLHFSGVESVEREGGVLTYQSSDLTVICRADRLPESIPVDVSELRPGDLLRVSDLSIPEGVQVQQTVDHVVVQCSAPRVAELVEEVPEEVPEAEAPAPEAAEAAEEGTPSE